MKTLEQIEKEINSMEKEQLNKELLKLYLRRKPYEKGNGRNKDLINMMVTGFIEEYGVDEARRRLTKHYR